MELVGQHVLNKLAPEDLDGNADASGTVIGVLLCHLICVTVPTSHSLKHDTVLDCKVPRRRAQTRWEAAHTLSMTSTARQTLHSYKREREGAE